MIRYVLCMRCEGRKGEEAEEAEEIKWLQHDGEI